VDVREMQRKLSQWATNDKEHKFFDIYHLLYDKKWLMKAHDKIKSNTGSITAGCDGINMSSFDENLEKNLQKIIEELQSCTFEPQPARRVYIPKPNGKKRPLGIPAIRDRIVQEALRMVLEPIYEADFSRNSFGFRPNRCTMDAIKCILWYTQENKRMFWVIEGDISSYFDSINHKKLMKLLKHRIKDEKILQLIWKFLKAGVMENKTFRDTQLGTPQGGIVSPLLANIYLHELDKYMEKYTELSTKEKTARRKSGQSNFAYVRYADDWIVLCNGTRQQAEDMKEELFNFLQSNLKLKLSSSKTKITHLNDGFKFLGFWINREIGQKGKMTTKVEIPKDSIKNVLDKIKAATDKSTYNDSISTKILALNRIYGGWCRYYQYATGASSVFNEVEYHLFWNLAHWIARKEKLSIPETLRRYKTDGILGTGKYALMKQLKSQRYNKAFYKPNPYLENTDIQREKLPEDTYWTGHETRKGMTDLIPIVLETDNYICQACGCKVTSKTAQIDHIKPFSQFKLAQNANRLENLQTLCISCHKKKTYG
jgi:group II intron reverse transcriptase/maturase